MVRATFINYFDVWGNEEDGWEVNNLCKEFTTDFDVTDPADVTDDMMIEALIDEGFLKPFVSTDEVEIDDLWPFIEFSERENGRPLGRYEFQE